MSDEIDFDSFPLARKGRGFQDVQEGQELVHHGGRTLTEGDNALFSTATCNWNPMHLNVEFARAHGHPDVVVNPMAPANEAPSAEPTAAISSSAWKV